MFLRLFCAVLLACGLSGPALAQTVVLTPTADGVTAEYRLEAETNYLPFADPEPVRTDWAVATPEASMTSDGVKLGDDRRDFAIDIRPDSTEDGRGYIALTRVGDGYILYAPALTADNARLEVEAELPPGWTLLPEAAFDGYLYLGPAALVNDDGDGPISIYAGPAPSPVADVLFESFDEATRVFSRVFGPLPRRPVIAITEQGAGPMPLRGDVTDSGMVSIRLHGDLGELNEETHLQIRHFAFHEANHLWNSHLAKPLEGAPWLHEGGAHYLGLAAAASTGHLDQTQVLAFISQYLTDCRRAVANGPDVLERISTGAAAYDCGSVIQWLADVELKQSQGTEFGIVSVWSDLIDRARQGSPNYQWADVKAALGARSAAVLLLEGDPIRRWVDIEDAMIRLGIRWVNRPSAASLTTAVLRHMKRQSCGGGLSYTVRSGYVEMENGTECGPLSGTVILTTVEGFDPLSQSPLMFDAVQRKCVRREAIAVTLSGGRGSFSIPCAADLEAPISYAIIDAPSVTVPGAA